MDPGCARPSGGGEPTPRPGSIITGAAATTFGRRDILVVIGKGVAVKASEQEAEEER